MYHKDFKFDYYKDGMQNNTEEPYVPFDDDDMTEIIQIIDEM